MFQNMFIEFHWIPCYTRKWFHFFFEIFTPIPDVPWNPIWRTYYLTMDHHGKNHLGRSEVSTARWACPSPRSFVPISPPPPLPLRVGSVLDPWKKKGSQKTVFQIFKDMGRTMWTNRKIESIHPGRLTWNLKITHLEKKMIFQTSMIMFHVNLPGCRKYKVNKSLKIRWHWK